MTLSKSPPLAGKQRLALKRIVESIADRGYPPTVRELARVLNVRSSNAVMRYLEALERKGYIRRGGGARSIRIPKRFADDSKRALQIELDEKGVRAFASQLPGLLPRQKEMVQTLHKFAPELAKLYYAAVRLLADRQNPARVYLVSHCVREIANRLPDHLLDVPIKRTRVEYRDHLDRIAPRWEELPPPSSDLPLPKIEARLLVPIPLDLFRMIGALVMDHVAGASSHRERAEQAFSSLDEGMLAEKAHLGSLTDRWREIVEWFIARAHVGNPNEVPPSVEVRECERRFRLFENLVYSSLHPFFIPVERLDEILEDANQQTS